MSLESPLTMSGSFINQPRGTSMHLYHVLATAQSESSRGELQMLRTASPAPGSSSSSREDIPPGSVFFNYPAASNAPPARWAHTAVAVGTSIVVFGGIGAPPLA